MLNRNTNITWSSELKLRFITTGSPFSNAATEGILRGGFTRRTVEPSFALILCTLSPCLLRGSHSLVLLFSNTCTVCVCVYISCPSSVLPVLFGCCALVFREPLRKWLLLPLLVISSSLLHYFKPLYSLFSFPLLMFSLKELSYFFCLLVSFLTFLKPQIPFVILSS